MDYGKVVDQGRVSIRTFFKMESLTVRTEAVKMKVVAIQ